MVYYTPMRYAVIATGGKQYKVSEGDIIAVEKLPVDASEKLTFQEVLLAVVDGNVEVGKPTLSGVMVKATAVTQIKGDKIRVAKFKAKVRYRRVTGHRQHLTQVKIDQIVLPGEKERKEAPKIEPKPAVKAEKKPAGTEEKPKRAPRAKKTETK